MKHSFSHFLIEFFIITYLPRIVQLIYSILLQISTISIPSHQRERKSKENIAGWILSRWSIAKKKKKEKKSIQTSSFLLTTPNDLNDRVNHESSSISCDTWIQVARWSLFVEYRSNEEYIEEDIVNWRTVRAWCSL